MRQWTLGSWAYEWNANGSLKSVKKPSGQTISFEYDALGRRTKKFVKDKTIHYIWSGNVLLHEIFDNGKEQKTATYVYEQGNFVPTAKLVDNESFSIVSDYIGRPIQVYDQNGDSVWSCDYDIYGKLINLQGDKSFIPFRQLGQYEDVETGLYYNRFRYYDCNTGTYISQDPIGLAGNNPNIYAYVFDSNTEVDVFGLNIIWNSKANRWYDSSNGKFVKRPTHLMKTKPNTAYFWSGRTNGIGGMDVAADIAKKNGGTTLEMLIEENNIVMPEWDTNKPLNVKEWGLMSEAYAEGASGKVRGVIGDDLRPGNIWEGYEKGKLLNSKKVSSIELIDPFTGKSKGFIKGKNH